MGNKIIVILSENKEHEVFVWFWLIVPRVFVA